MQAKRNKLQSVLPVLIIMCSFEGGEYIQNQGKEKNKVGGVEKFRVWVECSNNPTFKMRKLGHCVFHDLIPITIVSLWQSQSSSQVEVSSAYRPRSLLLYLFIAAQLAVKAKQCRGRKFQNQLSNPAPSSQSCTFSNVSLL